MQLSENKQILIDAVLLGDLNLKNQENIAQMIESDYITESDAKYLVEAAEQLSAKNFKEILNSEYQTYKSNDIQMLTEDEFSDLRNTALLLEADSQDKDTKFMSPEMKTMLYGATVPQLFFLYATLSSDKKEEFRKTIRNLAKKAGEKYNNFREFFRLFPKWEGGLKFKWDKEALPSLKKAADGSRFKNLVKSYDATSGKWKINGSKILVTTLMSILLATGITALVIYLKKYFSSTEKEIRKTCSRYPKQTKEYRKCELALRIKSCDEIIKKLQQTMPACKQKSNPYKCMNSIQKNIYVWQTRKKDYETRYKRIV